MSFTYREGAPQKVLLQCFEHYDDNDCNVEHFANWLVEKLQKLKRVEQCLFGFSQSSSAAHNV